MSKPTVSLPPPAAVGGLQGRRATWIPTTNEDDTFAPLIPPQVDQRQQPKEQKVIDPLVALEIRRASIATLPQSRWRRSTTPTPSPPSTSTTAEPRPLVVGPQSLVAELAKFDSGTPYEELRYVMELTAVQASDGFYPISSSSSIDSLAGLSLSGGGYDSPSRDSNFYCESDSTLPQARDAMDPILSPAARRYLDEYNSGQHRLPPLSLPLPLPSSPPPRFPWFPTFPLPQDSSPPPLPPPPVHNSFAAPFPFGPAQTSNSYFPGPVVIPIPPPLLPSSTEVVQPPPFDFQVDPSPSIGNLSDSNFSFGGGSSPNSSSLSPNDFNGSITTPFTSPSNSPNPEFGPVPIPLPPLSSFFKPPQLQPDLLPSLEQQQQPQQVQFDDSQRSITSEFLALRRQKKKSLVRLCAEEYARTKGAVKSWGIVKFFDGNKGWGFILDQSRVPGEDVWTHYTNLEIPRGHRFLVAEEVVEYLIVWDSKKNQLKALLVTGLGGTPLLAFSDPTLAATLTKFKPSQGPLPLTLSPETKKKIYAAKREKQRKFDEEVRKERLKRFLERERRKNGIITTTFTSNTTTTGVNDGKKDKDDVDDDDEEEEDEEVIDIKRGLLNFGVIGIASSSTCSTSGSGLLGLGLSGIEEEVEEDEDVDDVHTSNDDGGIVKGDKAQVSI